MDDNGDRVGELEIVEREMYIRKGEKTWCSYGL